MRNKKGFTLIEIMIGVAILTGMALLINTVMQRTLTAKQKVERRDEVLHSVRLGLAKITEDVSQAFLTIQAMEGTNALYHTGMKGTEDSLDFSTLSHFHYQKNAKDTDQVSVGYVLEKNEEGAQNLMRRESFRLGEKVTEGGRSDLLIENVKSLKFRYYDSGKEEWVEEWNTESVSALNRLPQAVQIDLTVTNDGMDYFYSTTALVDLFENAIIF